MWRMFAIAILVIELPQAMGQSPNDGPPAPVNPTPPFPVNPNPPFPVNPNPPFPVKPNDGLSTNSLDDLDHLLNRAFEDEAQEDTHKEAHPLRRYQSLKVFTARPISEVNINDAAEKLKISRYNILIQRFAVIREEIEISSDDIQLRIELMKDILDRYSETAISLTKSGQEQRTILENCIEFLSWVEAVQKERLRYSGGSRSAVLDTKYRKLGYQIQLLNLGGEINTTTAPPQNPQPLNLRQLDQYVKVNARPIELKKPNSSEPIDDSPHTQNSSEREFSNIYVNAKAREAIMLGRGKYPVGSVVINAISKTPAGTAPSRFAVMEKMPFGYYPNRGDWKYTIVDGASFAPLASGRIDSCIDCHSHYANTDFVSRTYLDQSK